MTASDPLPRSFAYVRAGCAVLVFVVLLAIFPYTLDPANDTKWVLLSWGALLLTAGWAWASWRGQVAFRKPSLFFEVMALFLALNAAAALRSEFPGIGWCEVRKYAGLMLVYLVASQVFRTPAQVRRLTIAICAAMTVAAVYALCQKYGLEFFPWADRDSDEYRLLPSTFGNPNFAAHALVPSIVLALYLAARPGTRWAAGFAAVFLVWLRFTEQRAGWLALGAAAVLTLLAWRLGRSGRKPVRTAVTALVLTAVLGAAALAGIMGVMKARTGSAYPLDLSLLARYKTYCSAPRMILEQPVLGHGPGVYRMAYSKHWTPYEQRWFALEQKMNVHTHNDTLEIAVDAGLAAAGLYVALIVLAAGYGLILAQRREHPEQRAFGFAMAALFTAFFVDSCFGFPLRVPGSALLLFLMAGCFEGVTPAAAAAPRVTASGLRRAAWRAAIVLAALGCALAETRQFAGTAALRMGQHAMHQEQWDTARTRFEAAQALTPWNWLAARQRGVVHLAQGDRAEAATHLAHALELNPYHIGSLMTAARTNLLLGIEEIEAAKAEGRPVASAPGLVEAARLAARVLALCPYYANAEEVMARAASIQAAQAETVFAGDPGRAGDIETLWREAEQHLLRAIDLGAMNPAGLYRLLVRVYQALEDFDAAEEAYVRAAQVDPADDQTWTGFFDFAAEQNRFDRLCGTLRGQIRRLDETPGAGADALAGARMWLAKAEQARGAAPDLVAAIYEDALEDGPHRTELWTAYAEFAEETDRLDALRATVARIGRAYQATPTVIPAPVRAAALAWEEGRVAEATDMLVDHVRQRLAQVGPDTLTEEVTWAGKALLRAAADLPRSPERSRATLNLAICAADTGHTGQALRLFERVGGDLDAEDAARCAQFHAETLVRAGRENEAAGLLRAFLEAHPDAHSQRLYLANVLARTGAKEAARTHYQRLLETPNLPANNRRAIEQSLEQLDRPAAEGPVSVDLKRPGA